MTNTIKLIMVGALFSAAPLVVSAGEYQQFDGFYGGVNYSSAQTKSTATALGVTNAWENPGTNLDFNFKKDTIGGQIGYQATFNNFLIGAELSFIPNKSTIRVKGPSVAWHDDQLSIGDITSLNAKIGYTYNSILIYGKVGASQAKFNFKGIDTAFPTNYFNLSKTQTGANLGIGVDLHMDSNISLGVEYNYTDWGSFSGIGEQNPALSDSFGVKARTNIVSFHMNYSM